MRLYVAGARRKARPDAFPVSPERPEGSPGSKTSGVVGHTGRSRATPRFEICGALINLTREDQCPHMSAAPASLIEHLEPLPSIRYEDRLISREVLSTWLNITPECLGRW